VQLDNAHSALEQADTLAQSYAKRSASAESKLEDCERDAARIAVKYKIALEDAACVQQAKEERDQLEGDVRRALEEKQVLQNELEGVQAKLIAVQV
jgi:hypothetical protein